LTLLGTFRLKSKKCLFASISSSNLIVVTAIPSPKVSTDSKLEYFSIALSVKISEPDTIRVFVILVLYEDTLIIFPLMQISWEISWEIS